MSAEQLYSIEQVAELVGVSDKTIRRWIAAGKVQAFKRGRLWRIGQSELERLTGKGGDIQMDFDYKKALRWLKVYEDSLGNYSCKQCGQSWSPMAPASGGEHYEGQLMTRMLCINYDGLIGGYFPCNAPKGYQDAVEQFEEDWENTIHDEREEYVEDVVNEFIEKHGTNIREDEELQDEFDELRKEAYKEWDNENDREYHDFINDKLAEWMEEQYAKRFAVRC